MSRGDRALAPEPASEDTSTPCFHASTSEESACREGASDDHVCCRTTFLWVVRHSTGYNNGDNLPTKMEPLVSFCASFLLYRAPRRSLDDVVRVNTVRTGFIARSTTPFLLRKSSLPRNSSASDLKGARCGTLDTPQPPARRGGAYTTVLVLICRKGASMIRGCRRFTRKLRDRRIS